MIPDTVKEEIWVKIWSGISPSAIATEIRETHSITSSLQQIHSMTQQIIQDLSHTSSTGENLSHSAAEQLIHVFKIYADASYVYVRYCMQTVFVTYMKSHGSSQQVVERGIQQDQQASS